MANPSPRVSAETLVAGTEARTSERDIGPSLQCLRYHGHGLGREPQTTPELFLCCEPAVRDDGGCRAS